MVNGLTMARFGNFAATHPAVVRAALRDNFSVASLSRVGDMHDCSVDEEELVGEFRRLAKNTSARIGAVDGEGEFREITLDEASLASGGMAAAVTHTSSPPQPWSPRSPRSSQSPYTPRSRSGVKRPVLIAAGARRRPQECRLHLC